MQALHACDKQHQQHTNTGCRRAQRADFAGFKYSVQATKIVLLGTMLIVMHFASVQDVGQVTKDSKYFCDFWVFGFSTGWVGRIAGIMKWRRIVSFLGQVHGPGLGELTRSSRLIQATRC
jgi:hypothetical protein